MSAINAFPLQWPVGWPRLDSYRRTSARFTTKRNSNFGSQQLSISDGLARVLYELERMSVSRNDVVVSSNVPLRLDGFPRSDAREPSDPGVAVYWVTRKRDTKVIAIDVYTRTADNLAAIAATLDAMRAIERHGGAQILERAFVGFQALPAPGQTSRTWRDVLGFRADEGITLSGAKAAYRNKAAAAHPDKGGSDAAMSEVNWAWEEAQKALV